MSAMSGTNTNTGPSSPFDFLGLPQGGELRLRGGGFDGGPDDEPWHDDDSGYRVPDADEGDDSPPGSPFVDY